MVTMITRVWGFFAVASVVAFASEVRSQSDDSKSSDSWEGRSVVISLRDDDLTDGRRLRDLEEMIDKAVEEEAAALIFQLDFEDPSNDTSFQKVLGKVSQSEVPSFAYIPSSAIGPGAILALATDAIYMGDSGIIGGAGVSSPKTDDEEGEEASSQRQSVLKARARSLAAKKGHRTDVAEAFIDESVEIEAPWGFVSEKDEVLTLTASEAVRELDGSPLLAKGVVDTVEQLIAKEEISDELVEFSPRAFGEGRNRARLTEGEPGKKDEPGVESTKEEAVENDPALFGRREEGSYEGKVVVIEVGQDTLATGKASFEFMERTLKKAELDEAAAVVFEMDTPGGYAWYTEGLVLNTLQNLTIPSYTFVNSRAESAGAIIAVGTDHIFMKPAATIGSALVVSGTGSDLPEAMEDKITQMMIGTVRNMAELKGHNPDVAEAFVTRNKEVKIDGIVIHEAGNVLNLNTIRATEMIGGKPVLAKGVAQSVEEIAEMEGLGDGVLRAEPLGMEAFAHLIQKISILLIVVGLAGAYTELNSPGFGLPGLISVTAFGLFFFGNYLAGNLAGYELAVLLVLGLILIAVEVFLFPGAILPGAVGAALVLFSLGLAMVDRVDLEWKFSGLPGADSWVELFRGSLTALALGMVGAIGLVFATMKFLPQSRLGSRLILTESVAGGASLAPVSENSKEESFVGMQGVAMTDLLPSGKGEFGSRYLDVVSDGEFIEKGDSVEVIQHEGSRIVVSRSVS
ncbi:MAG: NfeD family protein [Verrucomicrobiota bacterium]